MHSHKDKLSMKSMMRYLLLFTCICFVTSCATVHTTNFYTLTKPLPEAARNEQIPTANHANMINISVDVPDGLKRPQIVINNKNDLSLLLLEHHRWLSTFDEELSDALNSSIHGNTNIQTLTSNNRYQISLQLLQMDTVLSDTVAMHFHWKIRLHNSDDKLNNANELVCEFNANKPIGNSVDSAVEAMQVIVQDLIQIISQQIIKMESAQTDKCN